MNKILKAAQSHYLAQRDIVLSELDIVLNKSSSQGDTQKAIELFRELSIVSMCLDNISAIISDNETEIKNLNSIAEQLEKKLNEKDSTKNA